MSIFIIAEIGINHNGDINLAKKLIDGAVSSGCDAVKFQKRNPEVCVPDHQKSIMKYGTPWGDVTYLDYKHKIEFGQSEYDAIHQYCQKKKIHWLASAWDIDSQLFLSQYKLAYNKVASALLTHKKLLEMIADEGKHTFISTGMSTLEEIDAAVQIFKDRKCSFELMHCNSSYPMDPKDANLALIPFLRKKYSCDVGYSGHEVGLPISVAAAALGITSLERHITLDRSLYGSDQAASVEVPGFQKLVTYIRTVEKAMGVPEKIVTPLEKVCSDKLRRIKDLV